MVVHLNYCNKHKTFKHKRTCTLPITTIAELAGGKGRSGFSLCKKIDRGCLDGGDRTDVPGQRGIYIEPSSSITERDTAKGGRHNGESRVNLYLHSENVRIFGVREPQVLW